MKTQEYYTPRYRINIYFHLFVFSFLHSSEDNFRFINDSPN